MEKENFITVSFEELWSELSGSTKFGQDELIEMLSYQDDQKEDFYIYHRHKAFCVPLNKIREFFTRHAKPVPPMTKDQELKYLREKVQKLQDEAKAFQGMDKIARPAPDVPEVLAPAEEPEETSVDSADAPEDLPPPVSPKRDEAIPPPDEREKKSLKYIRADLAKELKDVKPAKQKLIDNAKPKDIARAPKE